MPFAERVAHLAPEGAYHMLARAQALEAAGRHIVHLEIGQPDVPTFPNICRGRDPGHPGRSHPLHAVGRHPGAAPRHRRGGRRAAGPEVRPDAGGGGTGRQTGPLLPDPGAGAPRRRGDLPRPRLPDLCRHDRRGRRRGRAGAAPRGGRLLVRPGRVRRQPERPHAADHPQLARQPHRRRDAGLGRLEHIAAAAIERDIWVLSDEIYSRLGFDGVPVPSIAACPAWPSGPSSATASPRPMR